MTHAAADTQFDITQGVTFAHTFLWTVDDTPVDLDPDYTAVLTIKAGPNYPAVITLDDTDGITLGNDGTIAIAIAAADTADLDVRGYRYTLDVTDSADPAVTTRIAAGRVVVSHG